MRISNAMQTDSILASLSSVENQMTTASQVASTGQKINAPSDDPVAAAQLARVDASISQSKTYQGTINTVQGDLTLTESSLASATDVVNSAQQIALEAADGSVPASDRQSMAGQIAQLQSQLLSIANQKGSTGYLFSGSQINAPNPVRANIIRHPNLSSSRLPTSAPIAGPILCPAI